MLACGGPGGIPELNNLPALQTRSIEMKLQGSWKQSRHLVGWVTLGALAFIAAVSPWFTAMVYACQNTGGGC